MRRRNIGERDVYLITLDELADQSAGSVRQRARRRLRIVAFFFGHSAIGAFGAELTVAMFIYLARLLAETFAPQLVWFTYSVLMLPFFPLQTVAGFFCGYMLAREYGDFYRSRSAELAWILPAFFLISGVLAYGPGSVSNETRWQHFFWSSEFHSRMLQRDTTLPFLASVTYSVGHYLGTRLRAGCGQLHLSGKTNTLPARSDFNVLS